MSWNFLCWFRVLCHLIHAVYLYKMPFCSHITFCSISWTTRLAFVVADFCLTEWTRELCSVAKEPNSKSFFTKVNYFTDCTLYSVHIRFSSASVYSRAEFIESSTSSAVDLCHQVNENHLFIPLVDYLGQLMFLAYIQLALLHFIFMSLMRNTKEVSNRSVVPYLPLVSFIRSVFLSISLCQLKSIF